MTFWDKQKLMKLISRIWIPKGIIKRILQAKKNDPTWILIKLISDKVDFKARSHTIEQGLVTQFFSTTELWTG